MSDDKRHTRHPVRLAGLCIKWLPKDFRRHSAVIAQYQQFFDSHQGEAVYRQVRVLNASDKQLLLALPSPALVNYLRLHGAQLQQEIQQLFGASPSLKLVVRPFGGIERTATKLQPPAHVSRSVSARVRKSADGIEDESLRQALIALAQSITDDDR